MRDESASQRALVLGSVVDTRSLSPKGSSAAPVQLAPQMQLDLEAFPLTKPIHHAFPRSETGRFERV